MTIINSEDRLAACKALPSGLIGLWDVNKAEVSGGRTSVPNITGEGTTRNLITYARHFFNKSPHFLKYQGLVVEDGAAIGHDDLMDAAVLTGANGGEALYRVIPNLPAGTYTLMVDAERNGCRSTRPANGAVRRLLHCHGP